MAKMAPGFSLRTKLIIAMSAIALIPLLLVNHFTVQIAEQAIIKTVFERNRILAENIAAEIDQMFAEKIRLLKIAGDNPDLRSMEVSKLVPALRPLPAHQSDVLMAIALAPNGDLLARSDGKQVKANYWDREYFHTASSTGETTVSDVLVSKTTGKRDIGIAEPLMNPDRTLRGMLVIGVSLQKIIDRIAKTKIGTTGFAYVVNKNGKILMHPDSSLVENPPDFSTLAPVKAAIGGQSGSVEYVFQGQEVLAGYSYVPTTGWGLIVQQPLDEAMAAAAKLRDTNIIIMMITVLAAVFIVFPLAGVVFKPIALLTAAARQVAEGDLAAQANFKSSDEIGTLATAFNHMTTQLKAREEALRQSQEKYRRIVDTSNEGIWMLDEKQRISFVNNRLSERLGYQPEEMIGLELKSLLFEEDFQDHTKRMQDRQQGVAEQYERRWKHRNGQAIWTIVSATPIFDDRSQFKGSLAMLTDITKRKLAEEEKTKLEYQLNQAQKIESIGQLAGGVAHDFNNMLGVILGHAELAMMKAEPSNPLIHDIEEIRTAAKRSADLTRQLLTFARKQTIAPRVLNLNETIAGMLNMLQRLIGENIHLSWNPATNPWSVKMDPVQIDQILANLCVNARDAISGIGKISIETQNCSLSESDKKFHPDVLPGDYVRLSVSDDGHGIEKDILPNIYEPFFTTKEFGQGTGLGLSTVFGAVKQNQGFIEVASELRQGTTFHIYLPRKQATATPVPEAATKPLRGGTETVLLVEDDQMLLNLVKVMLEESGYTVLSALDIDTAITLAKEHSDPIHLLLTDMIMPEMNGRDLKDILQVIRPEMKVIFMSGYTADIIAKQGVIEEGVHFLQKPLSFDLLTAKVREVLDATP